MSSATLSLFLDTNCFLQLRDIADLPWQDIALRHRHIELVIADVVISELDRFKTDSNRRRRDRSRAALKLIAATSEEVGFTKTLRSAPIEVSLRLAGGPRVDWSQFPTLDPNKADDQLVATAACEPVPGDRQVISYDNGPLIRARMIGLKSLSPPETWHLQDERPEEAVEIARLKRENESLRATTPTLQAAVLGLSDGEMVALYPTLPPLSRPLQDAIYYALLEKSPEADVRATDPYTTDLLTSFNGGISPNQVKMYQDKYRRFKKDTERFAADFHLHVQRVMRLSEVNLLFRNESRVTAAKMVLRYRADGGKLFDAHDLKAMGADLTPPEAPQIPGTGKGGGLADLVAYRPPPPPPRDPTGYYWLDRPEGGEQAALTCDEFRPGKAFEDQIWIASPEFDPFEGLFSITVDASNLSETIALTATVRVERGASEWTEPRVLARLPAWIADLIEKNSS